MGMRVTTSMMMNTYRYNLHGSTERRSDSMNKILTQRNFDSYAEDPAAATMAWRIRRATYSNFDYQTNNEDTYSRFSIAYATMDTVNDKLSSQIGKFSTIIGVNGTIGAGRQPLGEVLDATAETIVQAMNSAKYGDHFVFAGNDEMNAPFSWSDDMKTLYYRGINVNAGAVERPDMVPDWASNPIDDATGFPKDMPLDGDPSYNNPWNQAWADYYKDQAKDVADQKGIAKPQEVPDWATDLDANGQPKKMPDDDEANAWDKEWKKYFNDLKAGNTATEPTLDPSGDTARWGKEDKYGVPANAKEILEAPDSTETEKAWAAYLLDQGDLHKLDELAKEEQHVDLGMGLQEDADGVLINGTSFNRSLPGINMLGGYGVDEDGDPKNVVLIMKRIGELFSTSDASSGEWAHEGDEEEAMRLLNKIKYGHDRTTESYSEVAARSQFLQENQSRLEMQGDYLNEELLNIEQVDLADAITQFSWDYYCYSSALKVGTQLLSQTLLDYMS